ncbi:major histocompatibility complex class I-related gene protein-like [Megalops cyprinoides]|uniref:major histocompatibility complex class I-related gene protein-like n=1 Tax=Megalops cyprinoides TaxID=118141 RepID=UPI00186516FA|nr:major histocompatibility complex class I-related gene protein-like [Megalops cyprinoides]
MVKMERVIVLLSLYHFCLTSAAINSLRYVCTTSWGIPDVPDFISVGMLDGQPFSYYDSNIRRIIPRKAWAFKAVDPHYFERATSHCNREQEGIKGNITAAMKKFKQTGGMHTLQNIHGCEWDDETGSTYSYDLYAYDGEDLQAFYMKNMKLQQTVTADSAQSEQRKFFMTEACIPELKNYVNFGKSTLKRKVPPEVTLLQKDPSSPVTCHATGFYPKLITVSWQRDGEDIYEDVELGETLPNGDGEFQIRSSLRVSPEDMKMHNYTCTVQHSSLQQDVVKVLNVEAILTDRENGPPVAVIISVVTAALTVIAVVGLILWKRKSGYSKATTSDNDASSASS